MANKALRLDIGSIFTKGPGKIYFYRYQLEGRRKTVSLQTVNRTEALKKAQELLPVIQASNLEVIAAHVSHARGLKEVERNLTLSEVWEYYSLHPKRSFPATVHVQVQYRANFQEFVEFTKNPQLNVREVTPLLADRFSQYLKTTEIVGYKGIKIVRSLLISMGQ